MNPSKSSINTDHRLWSVNSFVSVVQLSTNSTSSCAICSFRLCSAEGGGGEVEVEGVGGGGIIAIAMVEVEVEVKVEVLSFQFVYAN